MNVTLTITTAHADCAILTGALAHAERGFAVFPCAPTKRPLTKHGFKDATTDPAQIRAWWKRWPDALIGLPTGGNLTVVDIDPRHGGTVNPSWTPTLTVRTRSGGWHLYYASIGGEALPSSAGKVAPGVDIRGEGGYVITFPSPGWTIEHPLAQDDPLPVLPASIAEAALATAPPHRRDSGSRSAGRFVARSRVPAGERNNYLASCAGWLYRQGYDLEEVTRELLVENANVCVPPGDEFVVEKIAESIERYHDAV